MGKIKVAVVGVGNCFAGLVQGIEYYKQNPDKEVNGVISEKIGPYSVTDIEFVAGFDVGENKVGKPLGDAVYESPNKVNWIDKVSCCSGTVLESPILDGVGIYVENMIKPIKQTKTSAQIKEEAIKEIKRTGAKIILNHLPVGSQKATEFWAEIALETGCGFVNAMPVFIASTPSWAKRFTDKNIPIIGDDYKGMVGATIVHRTLAKLCSDRGTKIENTYQINVGGNSVTGDQKITLIVDGIVKHVKIGEFIDQLMKEHKIVRTDEKEIVIENDLPQSIECMTVDERYNIKIVNVDAFIRHEIAEPIYEIETEEGRKIKITGDHNLFILNEDGNLKNIQVKDLKEDESLIAVPSSLQIHQSEKRFLDLKPYLSDLNSKGIENGYLKVHNHQELMIPVNFPISDEFLQTVGMWIADGSYDRVGSANIEIACANDYECLEVIENFANPMQLNTVIRGKGDVVARIMSKTIGHIFKKCFELNGDSYTKKIPLWIFDLSDRQIALFLKGYVSGDGGVSGKQVRWTSVSEELIEEMRALFFRIGINSTVFKEKYKKDRKNTYSSKIGHTFHGLITSQPDLEKFVENVGFIQTEKNSRILEVLNNKRKVNTVRKIPNLSVLRSKWKIKSTSWWRTPRIEADVVLSQLDKIKDTVFKEKIRQVCEGEVKFVKVRKIKKISSDEKTVVYDISTKPYERFICSNILVHNTDFVNMLERERLQSKKISKTESVQSQLKQRLPDDHIYVGPSDFIPFLGNTKLMFMRIEGKMWANIPYNMEVRLEVDDKANSSGVSADALRYIQLALDKKIGGPLIGPSAWLMKHPPKQFSDSEAMKLAQEFGK